MNADSPTAREASEGRPFSKYFLVRPQDLNHAGTLFGGVMMSLADEMAFVAATLTFPGCTFVTKVFKEFDFISGAAEGDIVRIDAEMLGRGRSSVRVAVRAVNAVSGERIFQTEAVLVNAQQGRSRPIPG
jgi:acyl-CoA hydrolase